MSRRSEDLRLDRARKIALGEDALRELEDHPDRYHVVFSDVVMPGMNGIDLARELRRLHPGLPIVLTSGYAHVLASDQPQEFDLLNKPYSIEELSRVLLRARRGPPASAH